MQLSELRTRHPAITLRKFLLSLCEQLAQNLRGPEANFSAQLTRLSRVRLRFALR